MAQQEYGVPGHYGEQYDPFSDNVFANAALEWFNKNYGGGAIWAGAETPEQRAAARVANLKMAVPAFKKSQEGRALFYERAGSYALALAQADINKFRAGIGPSAESYYAQMQQQIKEAAQRRATGQMASMGRRGGGSLQSGQVQAFGDFQQKLLAEAGLKAAGEVDRYRASLWDRAAQLQASMASPYLAYSGGGIQGQRMYDEGRRQFDARLDLDRSGMEMQAMGSFIGGALSGAGGLYAGKSYADALKQGLRGREGVR